MARFTSLTTRFRSKVNDTIVLNLCVKTFREHSHSLADSCVDHRRQPAFHELSRSIVQFTLQTCSANKTTVLVSTVAASLNPMRDPQYQPVERPSKSSPRQNVYRKVSRIIGLFDVPFPEPALGPGMRSKNASDSVSASGIRFAGILQRISLKSHLRFKRLRNSSLVFALDRIQPNMQLVVVVAPVFCTPRMTIHKWLDSMTTATPCGLRTSLTARATCFVNLSWTCNRRENISARRASFESPRTRPRGM